LCAGQRQTFSIVSYTTSSSSFAYPQFIYDADQATIDSAHDSAYLTVAVPPCYFQVDLIFGSSVFNEVVNADSNYGNRKLGAPYGPGSRSDGPYGGDADGTTPCLPKPMIVYQNACDGTFTASLANDSTANVDAVFLVAGQRVHVKPGRSAGARRHTGTLTIRDNTFTTHIASWEKPASCTSSAAPAVTSQPAGAPPPGAPPASASAPVPVSSPASASEDPPVDGGIPLGPGAPTSAAAAPAADSGSSSGLIIALGVVLMLAGAVILIRVLRTFRRA